MISLTRNSSRWAAAGFSVFALALASVVANGCGGIDCTETQTCPGVADAAPDQRVVDVTLPSDGPDSSVEPDSPPGDETTVPSEPVDMGDAEADAFDATLDAEVDATEEPEVTDAELDAEAGPRLDARPDAADAAVDAKVDACPNAGGPENCTNGIDDNCDGLIDCADPLCVPDSGFAGYTCAPAPPTGNGWTAPVILYDFTNSTTPAPTPAPCGGNYPHSAFVAHDQPSPATPSCACNCGGVGGGSCTAPTIAFYSNQQCSTVLGGGPVQSTCTQVLGQAGVNGIKITNAGTASGGACDAGVTANIPAFDNNNDWLRTGSACTTARVQAGAPLHQGGCAANQVCVEAPTLGPSLHLCAAYAGSNVCGGGYDAGFTYYTGETDSRSCNGAACSCGAPSLSCTPNVTVSNANSCTSQTRPETTTNCDPTNNYPSSGNAVWAIGSSTPTVVTSCTPSGTATISGGITKTGVVTVCCTQ